MKKVIMSIILILLLLCGFYMVIGIWHYNSDKAKLIYYGISFSFSNPDGSFNFWPIKFQQKQIETNLGLMVFMSLVIGMTIILIVCFIWYILTYYEESKEKKIIKKRETARDLYNKGIDFLFKGDLDNAMVSFEKSISKDRGNPIPYLRMADIFYKKRKYKESLNWLESAKATSTETVEVLLGKAKNFEALGDLPESAAALKKVLEIEPSNLIALEAIRELYTKLKRYSEALQAQKEYIKYQKDIDKKEIQNKIYINLKYLYAKSLMEGGEESKGIRELKEIVQEMPSFLPAIKLIGDSYIKQGKIDSAVEMWEKEYNKTQNIIFLIWIEDAYIKGDNIEGLKRIMELYKKASEKSNIAKFLYGRFSLKMKNYQDALQIFEELENKGFRSTTLHILKGEAYFKSDKLRDTISEFKKALSYDADQVPFVCSSCYKEFSSWKDQCQNCYEINSLVLMSGQELVLKKEEKDKVLDKFLINP